jgi:hypothetical protein
MAGIYSPTGRRIEARQDLRLPQLHVSAIGRKGWSQIVAVICLLMLVRNLVSDRLLTAADTLMGTMLGRSQAGLPRMEVDGCGKAGHQPVPRRSNKLESVGEGNMAGIYSPAGRQIEARRICRLPQLRLPVVHAIGSPQVAAVLWLLLPSQLILGGVSTPTDTIRGIAHDRSQAGLPGMEGHRPVTQRSTNLKPRGDDEMAAVCPTTRRQTGPWQQHRLPQLRLPVVQAIGSPQVAAVICLLMLPRRLSLDGCSTPTDTIRGITLDRSQAGLPGMEVDGCGQAGHFMPRRSTNPRPTGYRNTAGSSAPAERRTEDCQICRLPQLRLPVVQAIGSPQVAAVLWLLLPSHLILDGVSTPTDTIRGITLDRSQAELPSMEVGGGGEAGHQPVPRRSNELESMGEGNVAGICSPAGRRIEARQICRLPQLHFPVVHAIGSPEVAPVLWLLLPSHLILGGVSMPADTYRGIAHDRSQTGLPGKKGHRLVTHRSTSLRLTGEGEMAGACIQRNKVPGLGSGVDCPNFRIPTLNARVFASQCRHLSSSASHRIFDGSRGNLDTVYGINA